MAESQDTAVGNSLQTEREKHAAYMREYRAKNKERYKEIDKEHERRKREKDLVGFREKAKIRTLRSYHKRRAEMTPEQLEKHREQNRERNHRYYERHLERLRKKAAEYAKVRYHKDPQKALSVCHLRRAKIKEGLVTKADWDAILEKHKYQCFYCDKVFERKDLTQDHFIPLSKGGPHVPDNIVPACQSCNSRKGNRT